VILRRVKLSALLPAAQIRVPLRARTKAEAIEALLGAVVFESESQRAAAKEAVLARETEISTGIGRGVAVPHGRTSAVTRHYCAFGVAPEPIVWDAIDGAPCRLVFLCVSADRDAAAHIRVLSQVARVLNNSATRQALEAATAPEDVRRVFLDDEEREGL
jgi:mannitol/fructose-specific phosphotransferase system IIA component (Ntr-type)